MPTPNELYGKPWSEREYIIVLHSYFEHWNEARHLNTPFVQELARLLGRTPAAILMRLENYVSLDPEMGDQRQGLVHIGPAGEIAFHGWYSRREQLGEIAKVLLRDARAENQPTLWEPETVRLPAAFGGRYDPLDVLGEGGFGIVLSCVDREDGAPYAMKIIRTQRHLDREVLHRFRQEMRALRLISHQHVIKIYEDNLDTEPTFPAFIMELAQQSLGDFLADAVDNIGRKPALKPDDARDIYMLVLNATEILHSGHPRLVHRDINPNNILLMHDGRWVLADFGLVGFLSAVPVATSFRTTGRGVGTMPYAAQEQFKNFSETDERTDIYALGVLLWELFTTEYGAPDRQANGLPPSLEQVFLHATERDKNLRYSTVSELRSAFLQAFAGLAHNRA